MLNIAQEKVPMSSRCVTLPKVPIIKPNADVCDSIAVCRLHASRFASPHSEQPTIQVLNSNKSP
jgi:hypothetical protein